VNGRGCWLSVLACLLGATVLSADAQPSLSGEWSSSVTIDPAPALSLDWDSSLDLTYSLGDWSFESSSGFGKTGWSKQRFEAEGTFGLFSVESSLRFDPAKAAFRKWSSSIDWEFETVSLESTVEVAPNYVSFAISADGEAGDVSFDIEIEFRSRGGCALSFNDFCLTIGFPFACVEVASEILFSRTGFDEAVFEISDLEVAAGITLDLELVVEVDEKTVEFSPSLDFGDSACLEIYVGVETSGNVSLDAVNVYGFGLSCDVGTVSFEALSYVDGTHKLNGDYWEMITISFGEEGGCNPISGELAVYFLEGGVGLFDVGLFESSFSIALGEPITMDAGVTWDVELGALEEITIGFEVSW
jgi:hypothetical protein